MNYLLLGSLKQYCTHVGANTIYRSRIIVGPSLEASDHCRYDVVRCDVVRFESIVRFLCIRSTRNSEFTTKMVQ